MFFGQFLNLNIFCEFLYAFLDANAPPKWDHQKELTFRSKFIPLRVEANWKEKQNKNGRAYLLQGCHLSSTSKFPDFSLTFYSFPYPLADQKKSFLFCTLMVLTVSLQIWGLLLKERICSLREQTPSFKSSPQCRGRWA